MGDIGLPPNRRLGHGPGADLPAVIGGWSEGARLLDRLRLLKGWDSFLARLNIPDELAMQIAERARVNRTCFHTELLSSGFMSEEAHFRALAAELELPYRDRIDPLRLLSGDETALAALRSVRGSSLALMENGGAETLLVLAPVRLDLTALKALLARQPQLASRAVITSPTALRAALLARVRDNLLRDACRGLFNMWPHMSARLVTDSWQGFLVGISIVALPVLLAMAPVLTALTTYACLSILFLGCIGLRLASAVSTGIDERAASRPGRTDADLPVYTVLVALHHEAEVVPDLLVALGRLDWPRSKLEIKLVCEEDDTETLAAIGRQRLRPWVEVIRVPATEPRTKPKALSFALPIAGGDIVALYDAEDRPHPMQLREAWAKFRHGGEELACIQAPLSIANAAYGVLPFMFRIEYAALFRGILPWLSSQDLLIPLGGTSNHFRREALVEVGGWDPHNVTEDADLGARLKRFGYRTETIGTPTLEDAPEELLVWIRQRTRWYKGWMQTWLVHMRQPVLLYRELGAGSFVVFQILFGGLIASALLHPLLWGTTLALCGKFAVAGALLPTERWLFTIAAMNIFAGYGSFLLLGWRCLRPAERDGFWKTLFLTVPYWLLMSAAAYRALGQLLRRPHYWEKTPHRRFRRPNRPEAVRDAPGSMDAAEGSGYSPTMSSPLRTILSSSSPITASSRPS